MFIALYVIAAVTMAFAIDRLRPNTWDLDVVGYVCGAIVLAAATGVIGPTLDSTTVAKDGGKTAYAAKD